MMDREQMGRTMRHLAALSGMDVTKCELCDHPLEDEGEPYKRGLDGAGAHLGCLPLEWLSVEERRRVYKWEAEHGPVADL